MVDEKILRNVSILVSLIGLISLFLISRTLEQKVINIGEISVNDIGRRVYVCGKIDSKFVSKSKHIFLSLKDKTGKIKVVIFNNTAMKLFSQGIDVFSINQNTDQNTDEKICVYGKVDLYKNELEIICENVEISYGRMFYKVR